MIVTFVDAAGAKLEVYSSPRLQNDIFLTIVHVVNTIPTVILCQFRFTIPHTKFNTFVQVAAPIYMSSSRVFVVPTHEKSTVLDPVVSQDTPLDLILQFPAKVTPADLVNVIDAPRVQSQFMFSCAVLLKVPVYVEKSILLQFPAVVDKRQLPEKALSNITSSEALGTEALSCTPLAVPQFVGHVAFQLVELPPPTQYRAML